MGWPIGRDLWHTNVARSMFRDALPLAVSRNSALPGGVPTRLMDLLGRSLIGP